MPNGVFAEDVPEGRPWDPPSDTSARALFLGRLDAFNKGIDLLIDAAARFGDRISLTIQGPDMGDGKKLADQARARNVRAEFLAPDYATQPSQLIARYDLFCLPSRFNGFGLAALEAMVAGRVILVSEAAGISSHVRASGCGVVVAPGVESISSGLEQLLDRRAEWATMGRARREHVLEYLVWDQIATRAHSTTTESSSTRPRLDAAGSCTISFMSKPTMDTALPGSDGN